MSANLVVGVISFAVSVTGACAANVYTARMIGAINRRKRDGDLISQSWFYPAKERMIYNEYRLLYPEGRLHVCRRRAHAMLFGGFIGVAVCLLTAG